MTQVTPIHDLKGYLEPEQVERLIAAATNSGEALLVRIPWRTGIRVSELIANSSSPCLRRVIIGLHLADSSVSYSSPLHRFYSLPDCLVTVP